MFNPVAFLLLLTLAMLFFWPLVLGLFLAALFLLPLYLTVQSLLVVLLVPQQLAGILTNRALRKNHALEHATVNVLEEQLGRMNIAGFATPEGYLLTGALPPPSHVAEAARIALTRLKNGEHHLAIHPRCGTSLAAANLLFALLFLAGLWSTGALTLPWVLLALVAAQLLGRPVGMLLQRWVTTDAQVGGVELVDLAVEGGPFGLLFGAPTRYLLRTTAREAAWQSHRTCRVPRPRCPSFATPRSDGNTGPSW